MMLPFDDPRWQQLETFGETCDRLEKLTEDWFAILGLGPERDLFDWLTDQYSHQTSIANSAYAIVPYLVYACETTKSDLVEEYLIECGLVEMARLNPSFPGPELPEFLAADYMTAVECCQDLSEDLIQTSEDSAEMTELHAVQPVFFGNYALALKRWSEV